MAPRRRACKSMTSVLAEATAGWPRKQRLGGRVYPGPVDTAICSVDDGHCVADRMASGVYWTRTDKDSGSRQKQSGHVFVFAIIRSYTRPLGPPACSNSLTYRLTPAQLPIPRWLLNQPFDTAPRLSRW